MTTDKLWTELQLANWTTQIVPKNYEGGILNIGVSVSSNAYSISHNEGETAEFNSNMDSDLLDELEKLRNFFNVKSALPTKSDLINGAMSSYHCFHWPVMKEETKSFFPFRLTWKDRVVVLAVHLNK